MEKERLNIEQEKYGRSARKNYNTEQTLKQFVTFDMLTTFNVTDVSTEETLGSIPWKPEPNEQRSSDPPAESNFFSGLNIEVSGRTPAGMLGGLVITSGDR